MKKNNKKFAVIGLLAVCAIFIIGVFIFAQNPNDEDALPSISEPDSQITPDGLTENPADVSNPDIDVPDINAPDIEPREISPQDSSVDEQDSNDIPLTEIGDRPEPPELPDTAYTGERIGDATQEDVEAHEALDPSLTNPDEPPDITVPPVEPIRPAEATPQSGDRNDNGDVYIPGFGWIKDEGGGGQGSISYVDESKIDNIIGY